MTSFDYARLRAEGQTVLDAAEYPPKRTIMVHSGVTIGVALLLSVMSYLLDVGIAQTGGLGGIGARTILQTVQSVLEGANMLLMPFWSIGYLQAVLNWTRREDADVRTLLSGFRCFRGVLRLMILEAIVYVLLGLAGAYGGAAVFMLTPGAEAMFTMAEELAMSGADVEAFMETQAYMELVKPMVPFMLGGAALLVAPVAYRLRFAKFSLLDAPKMGALRAMFRSWRLTRRNCLSLLKLDLRFWWYHLAGLLILGLGYGDLLLNMIGVDLGISADMAMFVFYIAALLCEFGLHVWKKNTVFTVYGLAYTQLDMALDAPVLQQPNNVPWTY